MSGEEGLDELRQLEELRALLAKVTAERDALLAVLDFQNQQNIAGDNRRGVSEYMLAFNLSRLEAMMLDALMRAPISVTYDDLRRDVWAGRAVTQKAIGQRVHGLRARLLPYDIAVGTLRSRGYGLRQRSRDMVQAHLASWRATGKSSRPRIEIWHVGDKRQCSA